MSYVYANEARTMITDGQVWIPVDMSNMAYRDLVERGEVIGEFIPPIVHIKDVSAAQARLALLDAGLLAQVEAAVAAHPYPAVKVWFDYASVWERGNPYVSALAAELGLDDAAVDALFALAALK